MSDKLRAAMHPIRPEDVPSCTGCGARTWINSACFYCGSTMRGPTSRPLDPRTAPRVPTSAPNLPARDDSTPHRTLTEDTLTVPLTTGKHPECLNPEARAAAVAHLHDADLAVEGVRALLRLAGEDPDRDGLLDTPTRYVKAWRELTGRPGDPRVLLARQFTDDDLVSDEMIVVGPMRFTSLCEHHLLPFSGTAWLAYVPTEGVVGLSKVPRLVEHFARRPQVQERLTAQLAATFEEHVPALGVGVLLRAVHSCASMRGVRNEAPMTTSALRGIFRDDERTRAEFLALARA